MAGIPVTAMYARTYERTNFAWRSERNTIWIDRASFLRWLDARRNLL